jgi:hypothetical protein
MNVARDYNAEADFTSDIEDDDVTNTNSEQNGGTRQAGSEEEPSDVRSLLNKALKPQEGETEQERADRGDGRDATGKFVPKKGEEPGADKPATEQTTQQQAAVEVAAILSAVPEEHRATVQPLLQAREAAWQQYTQHLTEQVRGLDSVSKLIGERREAWAVNGITPEAAINQLFTLSDFASRDPAKFVQWFAEQHGLDLETMMDEQEPVDPQIAALQREIAELKGTVGQSQNYQQTQAQQSGMAEIGRFAEEKDAAGAPVRPHFDTVCTDMLAIVPMIRQENPGMPPQQVLQTAYDRAVWANPTTRDVLLKEQETKRLAEMRERANKARQAGSGIGSGGPSSDVPNQNVTAGDSVRSALMAAIHQHS